MLDAGTWAIIALFYAPLHFLIPILTASIRAADADARRRAIATTVIDCSISMLLAFALAIWLATDHLSWAVSILLLGMLLPYPRVLLKRPAAAGRSRSDRHSG